MTQEQADRVLDSLCDRGFDNATVVDGDEGADVDGADHAYYVQLGCSQCEALAINGMATHETGCPNSRRYGDRAQDCEDNR